jgi:outer membrane receptor for ferrienterochelin and colicins
MRCSTVLALVLLAPLPLAAQVRTSAADSSRRAVELEEIVVTADRAPGRASDAAAAVRSISRAEIESRAPTDLTTLLRDVPGVQIDPVVGSGAGVVLQGLGSDRVLVLLDGAPLAGRISGQFDLTRVSPSQIEKVEIVEGPQSTLYGSAAIGGVINLLTRRDPSPRLELATQLGSLGQRDFRGRASGRLAGISGGLDLGRRTTNVAPGRAAETVGDADRWDGMATLASALGSGRVEARVLGIEEEQSYRTASGAGTTTNFNDNSQYDALLSGTLDAAGATELRAHGSFYRHRFTRSATGERADGTAELDRQRVLDVEGIRRGTAGMHRWLAGAKVEREWLESDRIEGGERGAWTGAAFGSADWSVAPWLRATTGLRLTSGEVWGTDLAPRVSAVAYGPGSVYLKVGGARGFRAPSFKEQYTNFTNTAGPTYTVLGNPDLAPEYSWNASAEIGRSVGGVRVYGRGFRNWLRNFIETELVDPATSTFRYQNVERARTAGLEAGGAVTRGIVDLRASHAWLDTEDEASGDPLLGRAAHMSRGAVTVQPGPATLSGELVHTSSVALQRTAQGIRYQDAYARINLSAGVSIAGDARITAGVDNVADTRPAGAATNLGRRWFGGVSWGIGW